MALEGTGRDNHRFEKLGEILDHAEYGVEVDENGVEWIKVRYTLGVSMLLARVVDIAAWLRYSKSDIKQLELALEVSDLLASGRP